jgi:hypothetical protein
MVLDMLLQTLAINLKSSAIWIFKQSWPQSIRQEINLYLMKRVTNIGKSIISKYNHQREVV